MFLLDLGLTILVINTNRYADEGNSLINYGFSIIIVGLLYVALTILLSYSVFKYKTKVLDATSTLDYVKKIYSSDSSKFIFTWFGWVFIYTTIITRILIIIEWLGVLVFGSAFFHSCYYKYRLNMPLERMDIPFMFIVFIILLPV